jgi:hypothetical protein
MCPPYFMPVVIYIKNIPFNPSKHSTNCRYRLILYLDILLAEIPVIFLNTIQ